MRTARFTVLGPLMGGQGSQAFLGQEVGPQGPIRPVVMVFLPDEVVDNRELFERILEETKVAVRIDHRNVIGLHGLAKLEEGYARIVEFADAESLRSIYKKLKTQGRRLPPPIATAILAQACMGVHYAHELGISMTGKPMTHGGLRPETLLVGFSGTAKVTGFGAALIAEGLARAQGAESSIRDPYTAPEQIFGGRKAATLQTDVYGLGAVLYEALSGKPPFGQDASLAQAITSAAPSEQLLQDVPPQLASIVLRAMAKQAPDRFTSALEMREALQQQPAMATEAEVASFMEWLFPADTPQRQARRELLDKGRDETDAQSTQLRADDSEPTSPAFPAVSETPPPQPVLRAPATAPAPTPRPAVAAPVPAPPPTAAAPAPPPATPAPAPAVVREVREVHQERVVYRTHPAIYAVAGLLGGAVLVLVAIFALRPPTTPAPVVVAPPVAPPVAADPAVPDAAVAAAARPIVPPPPDPPPRPVVSKPVRKPPRRPPADIPGDPVAPAPRGGTGNLIIEAPSGSEILIDGKRAGTAPLPPLELTAGKHKVLVKQAGTGVQYRRSVTVKADLDLTMTVQFYSD
ncbi:MAG: serine/threonine-protein kinase [Pseudomonadota bacterium]